MENILKKIESNYRIRFNILKGNLESHKDWEVLNRVLNLDDMSCFNLFRITNSSLEDVGTLYSMLVNCLLDDSSFRIDVCGSGMFTDLYITWGNDSSPTVTENDIIKMLDLLDQQSEFDNCSINNREILREYFKFSDDLKIMMLNLASEDIKEEYKELKNKKN